MLCSQFERNMVLNELQNVYLHKLGLADRDADLTLYLIDKPNYGLGTFSTTEQYDLPLRPAAICPVRHAGDYLAEIGVGQGDAVKVDVQGFEPEVLRGLTDILKRYRPVLWCEIGAGTLDKIATADDLSELVPFKFNCLQLVSGSGWVGNSAGLRERNGNQPSGDYILLPV